MKASVGVNEVHARFGDRAAFLFVYLREAHPSDGWVLEDWSKVRDPRTMEERRAVASRCGRDVKFRFPTVVDRLDDRTAVAYAAWPERLFVIDRDGKVAYAGKMGPFGFWPTDAHKRPRWLKRVGDGPSLATFLERFLPKTPRVSEGPKRREL